MLLFQKIVTLLLVLGLGALFIWSRVHGGRAAVLKALERVRAQQVKLSPVWFDFDRDSATFDVTYATPDGRRHANRCKVTVSMFAARDVYWKDELRGAV